jgi:hypothetical protein
MFWSESPVADNPVGREGLWGKEFSIFLPPAVVRPANEELELELLERSANIPEELP